MKTMKKKKLAVIGIAGVAGMLYSATPASAQTFYQCMPIKCKAGEYSSGGKCLTCPANTYCEDSRKIPCPSNTYSNGGVASCQVCPAGSYCDSNGIHECAYGTYSLAGDLQCVECAKKIYYQGPGGCHSSKNLWTKLELSVGGGGCSCTSSEANKPTTKGVCGGEVLSNTGGFGLNPYYKSVILLSCDRKTGQTYFFTANNGDKDFRFFTSSEYRAFGGGSTAIVACKDSPKTCAYKLNSDSSVLMIQR